MQRRKVLIGMGVLAAGIAAWAAFRPELLFVNQTVNEKFPVATMASDRGGPQEIAEGSFQSRAHKTSGKATIHQLPDGKRVLRLTEFQTSNGPALHVYLVQANDARDDATVKKSHYIDLGTLKGNQGDQNYDIPADVDLNTPRAVTIWCARFGVNFATAPLMPKESKSSEPEILSSGSFNSSAHKTSGKATVYELPDGSRVLRLTEFQTSNGPDVHVYLVQANDVRDNATVKKSHHLDLGKIKGNQGDQNYQIPGEVDLTTHKAVTIWCARVGVNFGTAPLTQQQS